MSKTDSILQSVTETEQTINVAIKRPSNRYLDEFIRLRSAPDMLAKNLFPNAKEITESMAAYDAVRKNVQLDLADKSVVCLCPCDGHMPRTGAMFAYRTAWRVYSIDPALRTEHKFDIARLNLFKMTAGQFAAENEHVSQHHPTVIVGVHPHAKFDEMVSMAPNASSLYVVLMPCCVQMPEEGYCYYDWGIHSPKRKIIVRRMW